MCITAIGAGAINQAVKAVAIARKNVEEEAIDIMCKPEFTGPLYSPQLVLIHRHRTYYASPSSPEVND